MTLKEQVRFLNKLGVSYASIEKYSGVKQTTLWAWLGKEDAKLQRANEEKLRTYLKKFRNTINKRLKETVD